MSSPGFLRVNWSPCRRTLRQFSWLAGLFAAFLAWRVSEWPALSAGLLAAGAVTALVGSCKPAWVRPLYIALIAITLPIGIVVSELALLLIYFGQLLPLAGIFRLIGRDALQLRIDRRATSYWRTRKQQPAPRDYYRQF